MSSNLRRVLELVDERELSVVPERLFVQERGDNPINPVLQGLRYRDNLQYCFAMIATALSVAITVGIGISSGASPALLIIGAMAGAWMIGATIAIWARNKREAEFFAAHFMKFMEWYGGNLDLRRFNVAAQFETAAERILEETMCCILELQSNGELDANYQAEKLHLTTLLNQQYDSLLELRFVPAGGYHKLFFQVKSKFEARNAV